MATIQKLNLRMLGLIKKHRQLDTEIERKQSQGFFDNTELKSMKKRKLKMREEIAKINQQLEKLHVERENAQENA